MKKYMLLIVCWPSMILAAGSVKSKSEINAVTVFRGGAEIFRQAKVPAPVGQFEIILEDVSPQINTQSIRVQGTKDLAVLSVSFRKNYLHNKPASKRYQQVKDSLEYVTDQITLLQNEINTLNAKQAMLDMNRSIRGSNVGVAVTELQKAVDYYYNEIREIKQGLFDRNKKQTKLNELKTKLNNQLSSINQKMNKPVGEIVVKALSKKTHSANIDFSFVINNAGWVPIYDLRADNIESPINLAYKAQVYQSSGIDWNKVRLTISTGNPTLGGTSPTLNPWHINFQNPQYRPRGEGKFKAGDYYNTANNVSTISINGNDDKAFDSNSFNMSENQLSTEFDIDIPYNIPADGQYHLVQMREFELNAEYRYYCVPKMDKDAFLKAYVTDWEKLNLMPGKANVFFEDAYVGESQINPNTTTNDTLGFSLGRDKNVVVKREKVKDFTTKNIIGSTRKEVYVYDISVRNNKNSDIEIEVLGQYPISDHKDIVVELDKSSGAKVDGQKHELTWRLELKSKERKKVTIGYTVKYPKGKTIFNLN